MAGRKYNHIFSELVTSDNNLIGHVAYCLYKKQKVAFIVSFQETNRRLPNEKELDGFHQASQASISATQVQAAEVLSGFIEAVLRERLAEIESDLVLNQQAALKEIITPLIPKKKGAFDGFLIGLLAKFLQTIIIAVIIFLIIFAAASKKTGVKKAIYEICFPAEKDSTTVSQ